MAEDSLQNGYRAEGDFIINDNGIPVDLSDKGKAVFMNAIYEQYDKTRVWAAENGVNFPVTPEQASLLMVGFREFLSKQDIQIQLIIVGVED
jgi:hypothetical protein